MTTIPTRPLAHRAVADATNRANLTVRETGDNAGAAVETYLRSVGLSAGNPWCAAYVFYRYQQASHEAGIPLPRDFPRSGYTPDWASWGQKEGTWVPVADAAAGKFVPRPGDLVLFWFGSLGRIGHIGIVVEPWIVDGKCVGAVTVEVNTGPDAGDAVERDGQGVYRKHRRFSQLGLHGGLVRIEA